MYANRHSPGMDESPYLPASDGLLARKSGDWAKRKHHFLGNYCGITTRSMRKKWRLVYLDVMAGPGRCKIKETGEEFPGSPFVALDHDFSHYIFIEDHPQIVDALSTRVAGHPKAKQVDIIPKNWIEVAKSGRLLFDEKTLVVAFIDPTGISQIPMTATLELTKNRRIDMLVTIQHSLGITWNIHQYIASQRDENALDHFLGSNEWRKWKWKNPSEFTRIVIDGFSDKIRAQGFIGARHISVPEAAPIYRFTLFSRHPLAKKFWNEILKIDETGQRELL